MIDTALTNSSQSATRPVPKKRNSVTDDCPTADCPTADYKTENYRTDNYWTSLPLAWRGKRPECQIRCHAEDFVVREIPAFELSGEGEHLFLWFKKKNANTDWVARQLAKHFGIKVSDVGYAGKKDRHAVTEQYFSLYLPGLNAEQDRALIKNFEQADCQILHHHRHHKKLRVGSLKGNHFILTLRHLTRAIDPGTVEKVTSEGVPNYFGEQRFGHQGNNLVQVADLIKRKITARKRVKPIFISSARSFLFNLLLARRVEDNNWHLPVDGDCFGLTGSNSFFNEPVDAKILERIKQGDIAISGLLPGQGESPTRALASAIEQEVFSHSTEWIQWLRQIGVASSRRLFSVRPTEFRLNYQSSASSDGDAEKFQTAVVSFTLPAGSYATAVLRELVDYQDMKAIRTGKQQVRSENTD